MSKSNFVNDSRVSWDAQCCNANKTASASNTAIVLFRPKLKRPAIVKKRPLGEIKTAPHAAKGKVWDASVAITMLALSEPAVGAEGQFANHWWMDSKFAFAYIGTVMNFVDFTLSPAWLQHLATYFQRKKKFSGKLPNTARAHANMPIIDRRRPHVGLHWNSMYLSEYFAHHAAFKLMSPDAES